MSAIEFQTASPMPRGHSVDKDPVTTIERPFPPQLVADAVDALPQPLSNELRVDGLAQHREVLLVLKSDGNESGEQREFSFVAQKEEKRKSAQLL